MRVRFDGRSDERGATAIEYALIAGVVALGLLGTLVTTKTSLNRVFGQVSSGVSTPSGTAALPSSTSARAPYWQAKTLSGTPTVTTGLDGSNPYTYTTYNFTDGSRAIYYLEPASNPYPVRIIIRDTTAKMEEDYYTDNSGTPQSAEFSTYYDTGLTQLQTLVDSSTGTTWSNGQPASVNYGNRNADGTSSGSGTGAPTGAQMTTIAVMAADLQYFKDISR